MNQIVLIGRLVKDPELRYIPGSGKAVANMTLAVNRPFKDSKTGNYEADFIQIQVWGKSAENVANYLSKGSQAGVSGRLQIRSYEGQDGQRKWIAEVVADRVEFLDSKGGKDASKGAKNANEGTPDGFEEIDSSDIPF